MNTIEQAIQAAGGARAIAEHIGISRAAVYRWPMDGRVPIRRVMDVVSMARERGVTLDPAALNEDVIVVAPAGEPAE